MIEETKKLHEERAALALEAKKIIDLAKKEEREMTDDESGKFDQFLKDANAKQKKYEQIEKLAELTKEQETKLEKVAKEAGESKEAITVKKEAYSKAFESYMRVGLIGMAADELTLLNETKAQQTTTDSEGGYLIPEDFSNKLEEALLEFGGMRSVSTIFKTATGAVLPWPTVNTTTQKGRWLTEGSAITEQDVVFASTPFEAWTASSDLILVSLQLLQDSFFNLPTFLSGELVKRLGRLTNEDYTQGSGSEQPHGIVEAATTGKTAASASLITMNEMKDLKASVNSAYRRNGRWMFNDATLNVLSKLKDSDGRYMWEPDVKTGDPAMLFGHPYTINDEIDDIGANNKPVLFGDFKKYHIRDVRGFTLMRLNELYAANLQVGFFGFLRTDGKLIDAGTHPVKALVNNAT